MTLFPKNIDRALDASALKDRTDVAAARPLHLAGLDVLEIVERNLEGGGDDVLVVQPEANAGVADVAQGAGQDTALLIGEDQRPARGLQPLYLPSLSHRRFRSIGDKSTASKIGDPITQLALSDRRLTSAEFSSTKAAR